MSKRTQEHNRKIGESVKRYYEHESAEQREKRINAIRERKEIEKKLYDKYMEFQILRGLFDD